VPTDNPFSRFLRSRLAGRRGDAGIAADEFVAQWDRLETLVIAVFRTGTSRGEDEAAYRALAADLRRRYAVVEPELAPHRDGVRAGGDTLDGDPFRALLAAPDAAWFVGNRRALQLLPAAREALNRWLLALGDGPGD
jgi:hypothetical protein